MENINNEQIVLFKDKSKCCACGSCLNACPKQAISMEPDENGFVYPVINHDLCVQCGRCKKVCGYQSNSYMSEVEAAYVSAAKEKQIVLKSASGGLFAVLAHAILKNGGVAYGAAMISCNGTLIPQHVRITDIDEISKLQGSKYVQSDIGVMYKNAEEDLKSGQLVLFSGTPCQIAGLKSYLGKGYENLYTIDIICHGVPSAKFFQGYIDVLMSRYKGVVKDFKFRDKTYGWGLNAKLIYINQSGKEKIKRIPSGASSYFDMFLKSEIYRENCYNCPYTTKNRIGDITLGDYWGIQREHPELMKDAGGKYSNREGISCVLINSVQGKKLLVMGQDKINIDESTFDKVARQNEQLKEPSPYNENREYILRMYRSGGYESVEKYFRKRNGVRTYYCYIKNMLPSSLKKKIKKAIKRI